MLGVPYFLAFAIAIAAIGAWSDWRTGEIPNWVTLGALCVAPLAHLVSTLLQGRGMQAAVESAGFSVLGALACAVVPLALYRSGAMFGGDVKLLAALGAILRPLAGIEAEFYAFLAAAFFAPARLAYEGKLMQVLGNAISLVANPLLPKHRRRQISPEMMTLMRFGPAIFVGTCGAAITHWRPQ